MSERMSPPNEVGQEKEKKKLIVEIGTDGKPFFLLGRRKLQDNEQYVAVDIEKDGADRTAKMISRLDVEGQAMPIQADARKLPFANEAVDECVLTNVFGDRGVNFFKYYEAILQEIVRVLKKGGKVVVTETYTPSFMPEFMQIKNNADGTRSLDEEYFKKLGLKVEKISFDKEEIRQHFYMASDSPVFNDDVQITLIKE